MRRGFAFAVLFGSVLLGHADARAQGPSMDRLWTNPQRSVQVRAHRCGPAGATMCGTVVWANEKARGDARRGGTDPLVGAQLFRNFTPEGKSVWRGQVFVPDINKSFSGTVTLVDPRTLRAQGCLIGRIGCKSQTWTMVDGPAP
jgi:uncharacterized protein (DUF2147 family)